MSVTRYSVLSMRATTCRRSIVRPAIRFTANIILRNSRPASPKVVAQYNGRPQKFPCPWAYATARAESVNRPMPQAPVHKPPKSLLRKVGRAIADYAMIRDGDRVLLGVSGGKDSLSLLLILRHLQTYAPVRFELGVITVDPRSRASTPRR